MAFDAHKNLAISAVVTAPTPATSGTSLTVTAGEGARFPVVPFNATVWPANAMPTPLTGEVIRVTARATDTFTIVRAQEGSTARPIGSGDLIAATITAKTLTDLETQAALLAAANVFTAKQTIQVATPALALVDQALPANARGWHLVNADAFYAQAVNDAGVALVNALAVSRDGDVRAGRQFFEGARATGAGQYQAWASTGITNALAPIGGTVTANFCVIGQTVFFALACRGFTLPAIAGYLGFTIPPGYPPAFGFDTAHSSMGRVTPPGGAWTWAWTDIDASYLYVYSSAGNLAAGSGGQLRVQGFYFTTG